VSVPVKVVFPSLAKVPVSLCSPKRVVAMAGGVLEHVPMVVPVVSGPGTWAGVVSMTVYVNGAGILSVPVTETGTLAGVVPVLLVWNWVAFVVGTVGGTVVGVVPGVVPWTVPGVGLGVVPWAVPGVVPWTVPGVVPGVVP
jgi:hypothetical protein